MRLSKESITLGQVADRLNSMLEAKLAREVETEKMTIKKFRLLTEMESDELQGRVNHERMDDKTFSKLA